MKKAFLYQKLKDKKIKCLACAHQCIILPEKTGICGVRQNRKGELYLLVYGKAIAVNIDPIEKKPLFHFLPAKEAFSLGTIGCNFACDFCQNWDISQTLRIAQEEYQKETTVKIGQLSEQGQDLPPEEIVNFCIQNNIPVISYTYNEPTIFFEYAYDTAKLAHEKAIKNTFVSNGYQSKEAVEKISPYLDAINIDLKSFREEFYRRICKARLQPVLDNIKRFKENKVWVEVTTLIIPQENDSEEELTQIAEFIAQIDQSIPWHISRFFPQYKMQDKEITPFETLVKAYQIGKKAGLKYVYLGNIQDPKYESTFCPKCNTLLIERLGYNTRIVDLDLEKSKCLKCGEKIEGIWK